MKIVREDFWENPGPDWICRGTLPHVPLTVHLFESVDLCKGVFKIRRCTGCGVIDPCGVPWAYLQLALSDLQ